MQITILGGGGFLGRKLAQRLAADGALGGRTVTGLTLFDLVAPAPVAAPFPVRCLGGNIADVEAVKAADPARHRRGGAPGRRGLGPGGSRFRPRPDGEPARHAGGAAGLPRAAETAAGGLHLLGRQLQRRAGGAAGGRCPPAARQQLRRGEGGGRAAAAGCQPPRHARRGQPTAADRHHPPGPAEQGGVLLRLGDPAGAAAGARDRVAGGRGIRPLDLLPPPRGGLVPARHGDGHRARSASTAASTRRAAAPPSARCWRRWRRWPGPRRAPG